MGLDVWRKRLWHLRTGGWEQLREFERRRAAALPVPRPDSWSDPTGCPAAHEIPEWPVPDPRSWRGRRPLKVGVIADPFTLLAFDYEWEQLVLDPRTWRYRLEEERIDLLFVESAWHGNDGCWRYQLAGSSAPSPALRELVAHCKAQGIPTVFWNKEDPAHFEDFLAAAGLFDWVFTTDADRIGDYRRELGHERIGLLPFAAQPAIHNPIRPAGSSLERRSAAFGGTYFRDKFPERREQMEILLGGAIDAEAHLATPLDIFSRFQDVSEAYRFPEPYASRVRGELTYRQMLTANRAYRAIINVNSVVGSPSMCARRIFEAIACGAAVIGTRSEAVSNFFPASEVVQVEDRADASRWFRALDRSPELRDRMLHLSQRRIWREHSCANRVDTILGELGLPGFRGSVPRVTAIVSTNRPHQIAHVLSQMAAQRDVDLQALVLTHGFSANEEQRSRARDTGLDLAWIEGEPGWSLGDCYNALVERAEGDLVAKIDDDDLYGEHYLFDQAAALTYSNADLVGKHAHHMYLEGRDALCLRFPESELTWTHFVAGPTIMGHAEVFKRHPFEARSRGEDTAFLRSLLVSGARIFSSDRFGFIQVRSKAAPHTWSISDSEVLATSRVIAYGKAFDYVLF